MYINVFFSYLFASATNRCVILKFHNIWRTPSILCQLHIHNEIRLRLFRLTVNLFNVFNLHTQKLEHLRFQFRIIGYFMRSFLCLWCLFTILIENCVNMFLSNCSWESENGFTFIKFVNCKNSQSNRLSTHNTHSQKLMELVSNCY